VSLRSCWSCASDRRDEQMINPVDLPRHGSHQLDLEPWVLFRVGQEDGEIGLAGPRLAALENRGEERVAEVRHDHADVPRPARRQAAGGSARPVMQLLGYGENTLKRLGPDQPGCREGP